MNQKDSIIFFPFLITDKLLFNVCVYIYTEHSKENKTVPEKVATTCTEDGHKKQTTKTSTTI